MTTETIAGVSLTTKANVTLTASASATASRWTDGTKKSVGVGAACNADLWHRSRRNHGMRGRLLRIQARRQRRVEEVLGRRELPDSANSKFDIRVTEAYHYICHYA